MSRMPAYLLAVLLLGPLLAVACGGKDNANRRVVELVQTDEACSPAKIPVQAGEKIKLQVRNEGKKDHEVEGIEGAKVEEVTVPAGRTRSVNFDAPKKATVQKVKCYIPKGSTTIVELEVTAR